jgi:hypothetical protein
MQSHCHDILRFYADQYDGKCDSKPLGDNDECLKLLSFKKEDGGWRMEAMGLPGKEI